MTEWFATFFSGLYDRIITEQSHGRNGFEQAKAVKRLLGFRRGQRALDVPCGRGRLTFPLARMGIMMTGVDLSALYIRHNRREARAESLDIRFCAGDMRRIDFKDEFDAAFNWGGSFGYFSDADSLEFCRRILRALKPGGQLLLEGRNLPRHVADFQPLIESHVGDVTAIQRNRWDGRRKIVYSEWTLKRGKRSERRSLAIRIFHGREIEALLKKAGFQNIRVFSATPPYCWLTEASKRWIAIGTKPV
jgi:SAM-dependent methyltransferase